MVIRLAMHVGIVKRSVMRAGRLAAFAGRTARLACIVKFNHRSKVTGVGFCPFVSNREQGGSHRADDHR